VLRENVDGQCCAKTYGCAARQHSPEVRSGAVIAARNELRGNGDIRTSAYSVFEFADQYRLRPHHQIVTGGRLCEALRA